MKIFLAMLIVASFVLLQNKDSEKQTQIMDEALRSILSTLEWVGMQKFQNLPMANEIVQFLFANREMWKKCANAKQFEVFFALLFSNCFFHCSCFYIDCSEYSACFKFKKMLGDDLYIAACFDSPVTTLWTPM